MSSIPQRPNWLNYSHLADAIPGGVLAFDELGRTIYANERAAELFGLEADALMGKTLIELTTNDWASVARQHMRDAGEGERTTFDFCFVGSSGRESWARVSMTPAIEDGKYVGAVAILADISGERRVENRLRETEVRLRGVAVHTPGIIFELRYFADGTVHMEYLSEASEKYTGLPAANLMQPGADIARMIHRDDLDEVATTIETAARTLTPSAIEFRVFTDGTTHHLYAAFSVAQSDDRSVLLSGVAIDVGELKNTETKLRASQAQLHAVFDNLPFACWTLDLDGRFVLQNPPSEKRWGAVLGKHISSLDANEEYLKGWEEDVQRAIAGQLPRRNLVMQERGMSIHFRRLIVPIRDGDEVIGVLGVSVDTTEQRRLENQLAQSQKLDAIGRLAGGIAHDFNNLLTAIMSCVRLLERRLEGPPRRELQIIRDGAQRAAELTRQLLAFAKQEMVEPRRTVIDDIVIKSDRLLRRLIGEDIELVTLANSRRVEVVVDPVRLEQAIINLVVNGRDAMPKGGKISVCCDNVDLSEFAGSVDGAIPPGKYALIVVEDAGVGMSEETRGRAFEPFFTTRQDSGGTGLGLSSVYGSVHQAQGFVTLESTLGKGTKVGLYIPVAAPSEDELGQESSEVDAPALGGTETILVVEDEPLVMSVACQSLRMSGYTVLKARSSRLALEVASRHEGPIDLLLTDVIMPNGSGPELAATLRKARPEIAVLFMSGYTSERIDIDANSDEFLPKPFTPDGLDAKVRRILDAKKPS
ncbi:MAG: PAS domain S-box protein [Myxococcales bacterium]|nr:PAS domain S-box protein [Myxococcales bacterium]